jgi:hypothetical protein
MTVLLLAKFQLVRLWLAQQLERQQLEQPQLALRLHQPLRLHQRKQAEQALR